MRKRTRIALATLLSLGSGWAAAQSSVTLYGGIDAYVGRFKGAPAGVNAQNEAT